VSGPPRLAAALTAALLAGCALSPRMPATHYYQLAAPRAAAGRGPVAGAGVLAVETFAVDHAYDDDRIVYRRGPVNFDFYEYHRWSSRPGDQVADFLARAYSASGRFCAVLRQDDTESGLVLGGRVIAFEEYDETPRRWLGRVELELRLSEAATGATVWRRRVVDQEPLAERSPEGLARALSAAMNRIATTTAPALAAAARAHPCPPPAAR
jgi:ABC-type uncharacterized transport system auxiliary subunit